MEGRYLDLLGRENQTRTRFTMASESFDKKWLLMWRCERRAVVSYFCRLKCTQDTRESPISGRNRISESENNERQEKKVLHISQKS